MNGKGSTDVGKFLRQLRFEHEESQEDMAKRLGVTTPYISLLGGKQPITRRIAISIIKGYQLEGKVKDSFIDMVSREVVRRFWKVK